MITIEISPEIYARLEDCAHGFNDQPANAIARLLDFYHARRHCPCDAMPDPGPLDGAKPAPDSASDVPLPRGKRDNSRYIFEGERYKKGPLVRAIVAAHVDRNPAMTYSKLCEDFPKELQGSYGVVGKRGEVRKNPRWKDPGRRFFVDNPIVLADGVTVVVCSQWGDSGTIRNFPKFLMAAKKLGYTVAKVSDDTDA